MRYCIGCTMVENKKSSPPYLLTVQNVASISPCFDLTLFTPKECMGKQLLIMDNIKEARKTLTDLQGLRPHGFSKTYNYYLLKVDSLNFPFLFRKDGYGRCYTTFMGGYKFLKINGVKN